MIHLVDAEMSREQGSTRFEMQAVELEAWIEEAGSLPVRGSDDDQEVELAVFLGDQVKSFNKGKLTPEREQRLRRMPLVPDRMDNRDREFEAWADELETWIGHTFRLPM